MILLAALMYVSMAASLGQVRLHDPPLDKGVTLEGQKEEEIDMLHRTDSLSMLILISLLIATVLVTWLFKVKKFEYFHETGVSMIFGILVGGVIQMVEDTDDVDPAFHLDNCQNLTLAPHHLQININGTHYSYTLNGIAMKGNIKDTGNELEDRSSFNAEIFFYVLLPPIVFYAGYQLQRHHFFRNIGTIITYALFGTTISCLVTGSLVHAFNSWYGVVKTFDFAECLLFGAMVSATDPVTVLAIYHDMHVEVDLYALVFGESVLNDAVAIVLYRAIESYQAYQPDELRRFSIMSFLRALGEFVSIFSGSFLIGAGVACFTALLTKLTKIGMHPILETALFLLMSYSTYLLAEVANWSGIVAVLFCGITQKHYTFNNLSPESAARTVQTFEILCFMAENFIFSYIGLSFFLFPSHQWDFAFIAWSFLAIQIGRALHVYPLSFILNLGRDQKISTRHQHAMMWAGLRGAIAFALAIRNTVSVPRQMMLTAILCIVLVSVIVQGGFTLPITQLLNIQTGLDEEEGDKDARLKRLSLVECDAARVEELDAVQESAAQSNMSWPLRAFVKIDNRYLKPLFIDREQ